MNIELSILNKNKNNMNNTKETARNIANTNTNTKDTASDIANKKHPLYDTSSNDDSYVNIDMDIDNETFIRNTNSGNMNSLLKYNSNKNELVLNSNKDKDNDKDNDNDNDKVGGNIEVSTENILTYKIPKYKKLEQLNKELDEISDKSTIYEYHFEKLNKIYDGIGFVNLIIDLLVILVGSISLTDIIIFEPDIIVIILGFINGIFTGINKIFKYKDKITHIGTYMSDLEHLKDDVKIMLIKTEYENTTDRDYLKQLQKINLILTNGNSAIFNIDSSEYYDYYNRMKQIKERKRKINHEIYLEKERKYNEFSKKHLKYLSNRLNIKKDIKDIQGQANTHSITDFNESNLFTITNLTTNEE